MARVLDIDGTAVRVNDTLGDYLWIHELFQSEAFDGVEKYSALVSALYVDPEAVVAFCEDGDALWDFVSKTLWEAFGLDITGERDTEDPVMDWDEDRARVNATCRSVYGFAFADLCELPYTEACELMGMAPHDSPMGQALYYRTAKPPERTKYNGDYVDAWNEAKRFYALGASSDPEARMRNQNAAADARFEALKRAAEARAR